jgi:hypothetical protein
MEPGGAGKIIHIVAALVGGGAFVLGVLMALPEERAAGRALIIGGAIIIVGALIASAIIATKT